MVIPSYFPLVGGAEKQTSGVAKSLEKISCDVTILTRLLPNTKKIDIIDGISVIRLNATKNRAVFLFNLLYFLFKNRKSYDIIHVHTLNSPAIISAIIADCFDFSFIIPELDITVPEKGDPIHVDSYFSTIIFKA